MTDVSVGSQVLMLIVPIMIVSALMIVKQVSKELNRGNIDEQCDRDDFLFAGSHHICNIKKPPVIKNKTCYTIFGYKIKWR